MTSAGHKTGPRVFHGAASDDGHPLAEAREALFHRLVAMYAPYFGRIAASSAHLEQMARDSADEERSLAQLEGLVAAIERPLTGMSFLEVGSGIGLTVAAARKVMKAEAYGIEPGDAEYEGTLQLSRAVLAEAGLDPEIIRDAMGEVIPFPDNYFDVATLQRTRACQRTAKGHQRDHPRT